MIARNDPVFLLRLRVLGAAGLISLALCLLLPLLALVCWLGGSVVWILAWLVIGVFFALFYALLIGGGLGAVLGFLALFGDEEARGAGCGLIVGGGLACAAGRGTTAWWGTTYALVRDGGRGAYDACAAGATSLLTDVWLGWGVVWLVWGVLAAAIVAAAVALAVIVLLRVKDWSRGPLAGVRYTCPNGHRAGVAFACPSCGAWETALRPSAYGVFRAACGCGRDVPTTDLFGRNDLTVRCLTCKHPIEHGAVGHRSEYHVGVWEAPPGDDPTWLQTAARQLSERGAEVKPRVPTAGPLPATLVAGSPCGRGLIYAYNLRSDAAALGAADEAYLGWWSGFVLVLTLRPGGPIDGPDGAVAALLNFWDRARTGRSGGRHPLTVAVAVRWPGGALDLGPERADASAVSATVRAAVEQTGFENVVRALEARFRRVAFFALNAPPRARRSVPVASPGAVLGWMCRQVGG